MVEESSRQPLYSRTFACDIPSIRHSSYLPAREGVHSRDLWPRMLSRVLLPSSPDPSNGVLCVHGRLFGQLCSELCVS